VPDLKFTKKNRLLSSADFKDVFDNNTFKVSHPKLLLLAHFTQHPTSRLGLVVGKKNIPTAVGRNFVKRVVRETFRSTSFLKPVDVIFLARKNADKLSPSELSLLLQQSWCRLHDRCARSEKKHA
jgi:ribonuclease P protein component